MSESYVGEIRMFAGNFAPRGWATCDGQLVAGQSEPRRCFSLLGTLYGGDGRTTFGLPDMRGRVPIHHGQGPGLSNRPIGQKSGTQTDTLSANEVATASAHALGLDRSGLRHEPGGQRDRHGVL